MPDSSTPDSATNDDLLDEAARLVPELPWAEGLQGLLARVTGMNKSTITRRFGSKAAFEDALADYAVNSSNQDEKQWASAVAEIWNEAPGSGLSRVLAFNWGLVQADERLPVRMTLWGRVKEDIRIRDRFMRRYARSDAMHTSILRRHLADISAEHGHEVKLREGMTESTMAQLTEAMTEGLAIRAATEPQVDAEMFSSLVEVLITAATDIRGDGLSLDERIVDVLDPYKQVS